MRTILCIAMLFMAHVTSAQYKYVDYVDPLGESAVQMKFDSNKQVLVLYDLLTETPENVNLLPDETLKAYGRVLNQVKIDNLEQFFICFKTPGSDNEEFMTYDVRMAQMLKGTYVRYLQSK